MEACAEVVRLRWLIRVRRWWERLWRFAHIGEWSWRGRAVTKRVAIRGFARRACRCLRLMCIMHAALSRGKNKEVSTTEQAYLCCGQAYLVIPLVPGLRDDWFERREFLVGHGERTEDVLFEKRCTGEGE